MTLCPVAIAITCGKCPVVGFCPAREIIGDYKPDQPAQSSAAQNPADTKSQDTH